ncbi:MAG: hypothetical protein ACFFDN_00480 [Candidatus Hodarchaeota archaeon]
MRKELQKKFELNQREKYKATFERFGSRPGYKKPIKTVLLKKIVDKTGKEVADHLWIDCGKRLDKLDLKEGEMIQFFARVKDYGKGYQGYNEFGEKEFPEIDYGLSYPSQVYKLHQKYIIKEIK